MKFKGNNRILPTKTTVNWIDSEVLCYIILHGYVHGNDSELKGFTGQLGADQRQGPV